MKRLIFMLAMLFCITISCIAQKEKKVSIKDYRGTDLKSKVYVENAYIDKFCGNWYWENGSEHFTVLFEKKGIRIPGTDEHVTIEMLNGKYQYIKNGIKSRLNKDNFPLLGVNNSDGEPISFTIPAPQGLTADCKLFYIDKNTLKFKLGDVHEITRAWFPLPKEMILKRVANGKL